MLNLDSETRACSPSAAPAATCPCARCRSHARRFSGTALTVTVGGLLRRSPGAGDPDRGRGNANLSGPRTVRRQRAHAAAARSPGGGLKDNAIPRESRAVIAVADAAAAQAAISDMDAALRHEYAAADPDVFARSNAAQPQQLPMDEASTQRAVCMLCCLPNGVQTMSRDIPGLVTNVAESRHPDNGRGHRAGVVLRAQQRGHAKEMLVARLRCLMAQLGGTVTVSGDYPAWGIPQGLAPARAHGRRLSRAVRPRPESGSHPRRRRVRTVCREAAGARLCVLRPRPDGRSTPAASGCTSPPYSASGATRSRCCAAANEQNKKPPCTDRCRAVCCMRNCLRSSCSSLCLRAATATMPESATSAIMFGSTMSWLNISVSSQTRSLDRQEPRKMKMMAMME